MPATQAEAAPAQPVTLTRQELFERVWTTPLMRLAPPTVCTREVNNLRKRLLKMRAEYTAEVVLIMTRNKACEKAILEALLRTPSMKKHIAKLESRITELLNSWK